MTTGVRVRSWWAKAWLRAVEEAAYEAADLTRARSAVRAGRVGTVTVEAGALYATVHEGDDVTTPQVAVPRFDEAGVRIVVEAVGAEAGRLPAVLGGDLPYALVEHCDELGAEVLPAGGEFDARCRCDSWLPVCPHALAVLTAAAGRLDAEPALLLRLRGVEPDDLTHLAVGAEPRAGDLEVAWTATREARRLLDLGPETAAEGGVGDDTAVPPEVLGTRNPTAQGRAD